MTSWSMFCHAVSHFEYFDLFHTAKLHEHNIKTNTAVFLSYRYPSALSVVILEQHRSVNE
jgi:hypothetical protein